MADDLLKAALAARAKAHAPYSKYAVGAAVRDEQGRVFAGCNVENASFPEGWCAEASAIAAFVLAGGRRITEVAVAGTGEELCTPCGGCRQRIREFADVDVVIHCHTQSGKHSGSFTLGALLPASFGPEDVLR